MRPGTPKVIGARLREAREARGLSGPELARGLSVTRQAVWDYESARKTPSPDILGKMVGFLGMPLHFFFCEFPSEEPPGTVFYRSMSTATKGARTRAERHYVWLRRIIQYLKQYVQFPQSNFPPPMQSCDPASITDDMVEEAAGKARQHWNLGSGPLPSITLLLERAGAHVVRQELGADKLDAFSEWPSTSSSPFFILGSDKASSVRSRFDACHELGHMCLHRELDRSSVKDPVRFNLIEGQAHRFASAFLMPDDTFSADFYVSTAESFLPLKVKWKVSVQAMIVRGRDLNLISPEREKRLWRSISVRQWRRREPLDDQIPTEQPTLVEQALALVLEDGNLSRMTLEQAVALHATDIEMVCGLPLGFLDNRVALLRRRILPPQLKS